MHALHSIAIRARYISATACFGAILLAGCSALPAPPARPVLYDFGPGALAAAPADQRAPLPPIALADVEGADRSDASSAVLYRLAYADARQPRPYQFARWSQPPAQLLQQDLRSRLGQRRAVLRAEDAQNAAREAGAARPAVLRVELEEFSQVFTRAADSVGLVRLRATLVEPGAAGDKLLGQRLFIVQKPAASADAAGGTRALAEAAAQATQDIAQWLEQMGR